MTMYEDENTLAQGYAWNDDENRNRKVRRSFKKAREDYIHESNSPNDFSTWMKLTWGIQFNMNELDEIVGWEVIDETKFLMYYLKYQ